MIASTASEYPLADFACWDNPKPLWETEAFYGKPKTEHFQIRLHKGRNYRLFYAVASVRTAVWNPSDVYLDHTGRSLFWRKYRRVCIEYPIRRGHRRDRPYMAVIRCSLVCAADRIQTSALIAGQFISNIMQISATSYWLMAPCVI